MKTYKPMLGERIEHAAAEMVKMAAFGGEVVTATFNDIPLDASPTSDPADIVRGYDEEMERRHQQYIASPEYAQRKQEMKDKEAHRKQMLDAALALAPEKPAWKDPEAWQKSVDANTDSYGGAVMTFAERWAQIMEGQMKNGVTVAECAKAASHIADDEGITGFMYGCAVSILSQCWIHGEELRRWHNLDTQIKDEGERANESGGVLNPALLVMKS